MSASQVSSYLSANNARLIRQYKLGDSAVDHADPNPTVRNHE